MATSFFDMAARKAAASGSNKSKRTEEQKQHRPWVEKYRPKTMEEVASQDATVQVLKKALQLNNLPHMLFYGPPGTGKTSAILALCRQLFGPELMPHRVLELNASDERGITVVREKIKTFAKSIVASAPASAIKAGYPCPPFKIIVLDEADSMTQDAQSALRRIMEKYSSVTRFCLVCNYVTRIIEPLTSRCSKFRFRSLDTGSARERIEYVAQEEKVQLAPGVVGKLLDASEGDMRRALMYLQSAARLRTSEADPVPPEAITEVAGVIPHSVIIQLLSAARVPLTPTDAANTEDADMPDAGTGVFNAVQAAVAQTVQDGYAANQVLSQVHDYLVLHPTLSAKFKAQAALAMGSADKALTEGGDEELHLLDLILILARLAKAEQA